MRSLLITVMLLVLTSGIAAQPALIPQLRSAIYRIEIAGVSEGTATMFKGSNSTFLITNAHVTKLPDSSVADSILLYINHITPVGEVVSGPDYIVIHLKTKSGDSLYVRLGQSADLAFIPMIGANTVIKDTSALFGSLSSNNIPPDTAFTKLITRGLILTAIGYPSKQTNSTCVARYPEYRWGRLVAAEGEYVTTTIPVVPGSSGSPVYLEVEPGLYGFVGIATQLKPDGQSVVLSSAFIRREFGKFISPFKKQ